MSLYNVLHLLFGEYVFSVKTKSFPRFATLIAKENLGIWGIKNDENKTCFRTSTFSAEAITQLATELGISLESEGKKVCRFCFRGTENATECSSVLSARC